MTSLAQSLGKILNESAHKGVGQRSKYIAYSNSHLVRA